MLDLDGDGLELRSATSTILFDHDADGIRTGTGWLNSDDGILVRDVNGNGRIDSGRELFGVDTLKRNGQKAINGFDALKDLDSNADGQLTSADTAWTSLQIWRDLDQDGVSDAGELFSMAQMSITRIGAVGSTTVGQAGTTVNGNLIAQSATFTRAGVTHDVDAVSLSSGAVDLQNTPFFREYTDSVPITAQAQSLPDMRGSGRVRDLREAASLSTALATQLSAAAQATTRDTQRAQLDGLITQWAQSGDFWSSLETTLGGTVTITGLPAGMTEAQYRHLVAVLEVFNGERFYTNGQTSGIPLTAGTTRTETTNPQTGVISASYVITPPAAQLALLQQSYDALKESIYTALVVQTRLAPYLDSIVLTIDEHGITFDASPLAALLDSRKSANVRGAFTDLVELERYATDTMLAVGFDGAAKLRTWIDALPADSTIRTDLAALDVLAGSGTSAALGSSRSDLYLGDASDNFFQSGAGDDIVFGGAGADTLYGEDGNDRLAGGAGNDLLAGGRGDNTYVFARGDGQDVIRNWDDRTGRVNTLRLAPGIAPSEVLVKQVYDPYFGGRALEVSIAGTTDKVTLHGFFYADTVDSSNSPVQRIQFADGTTWDTTAIVAKALAGTSGNDDIRATVGNDTLAGGAGDDRLAGAAGHDTITGGIGNDYLEGNEGNDTLIGNEGDDTLFGGEGYDSLEGGAGNDLLDGGNLNNTYWFGRGDGQDIIRAYDSAAGKFSVLRFKAGVAPADVGIRQVYDSYYGGRALEVSIAGTTGTPDKVVIQGFFYGDAVNTAANGVQRLQFTDGTVWDVPALVAKAMTSTAGNDDIRGTVGNDTLAGGAGDDTLAGAAGNDWLTGGTGNDRLEGNEGNDTLIGNEGDDSLYGNEGSDSLEGAAGNDLLDGGAGANTYWFGRGDGQDTIRAYDSTAGKFNLLRFKAGVAPADVAVRQVYDSYYGGRALEVSIVGTPDKVIIQGFFYNDTVNTAANGVQRLQFADGTVWDVPALVTKAMTSTAGNDDLRGTVGDDTLAGGAGDDTLRGAAGHDTITGGTGNDYLDGNEGNDTLVGNEGDDTLFGGDGYDSLEGGAGNDLLDGGNLNNTYWFGRGDGQDIIRAYDSSAGKFSVLRFKTGVAPADVAVRQVYDSYYGGKALQVSIAGTTDKVTIQGFFYNDTVNSAANGVQRLQFADGTVWDVPALVAKAIASTAGNDDIRGTVAAEVIDGGAGDDTIAGAGGNDTIAGGTGNDNVYGNLGNDWLTGGAGDDRLDGNEGNDTLIGNEGNDTLYGSEGDDSLEGAAGNDVLDGGAGNNVYWFGRGDGQDTLRAYDSAPGKLSTLRFKTGVAPADVSIRQVYDNYYGGKALEVSIAGTTDKVTVQGFFYNDTVNSTASPIQRLQFADGTLWDSATIVAKAIAPTAGNDDIRGTIAAETINAGAGDDTIAGAAGNDTLAGGDGSDYLYGNLGDDVLTGGTGKDYLDGNEGNDTLIGNEGDDALYGSEGYDSLEGGTGNDLLDGGSQNNTYWFGRGDGQDIIRSYDIGSNKFSVLRFKSGVAPADVSIRQVYDSYYGGKALEVSIASTTGTTDKVTIQGFFYNDTVNSAAGPIQRLQFADGTVWDTPALVAKALTATAGNDDIRGTIGNDTLSGGLGDDTLVGAAGNDTLDGGAGNDRLEGMTGADTYRFARGAGRDTVVDVDATAGVADIAQFGASIDADQLWFRQQGSSLEVSIIGTSDSLTIDNWYAGSAYRVEQFKLSDGRALVESQVQSLVQAMAAFSPPAPGQTTLPPSYHTGLDAVIAANWR